MEKKFAAAEELQKMAEDDLQDAQQELTSLRQQIAELQQNAEKQSGEKEASAAIVEE